MSILEGRKGRQQRVAGKPAAVNPPPPPAHNRFAIQFCSCTYTLSWSLQTQLIRFDAGAITLRGPTVGLTEPIVIIDTRQLFHSGPTMLIIGFKCMTSWVPDFNGTVVVGTNFLLFVRLIWQLSNLERAIWHDKILWVKCTLLQFFGFSDKYANGLFESLGWLNSKKLCFIESTNSQLIRIHRGWTYLREKAGSNWDCWRLFYSSHAGVTASSPLRIVTRLG